MKTRKLLLLLILICIFAHLMVVLSNKDAFKLVRDLALPSLGILAGLLIGAVGVFLGSLGNLYTILKIDHAVNVKELSSFFESIKKTVKEVKQDVIFVIISIGISLLLPFFVNIDLPFVTWPFEAWWLSKSIVLTSIALALVILAFVAILDCVGAMFKLHQIYERLLEKHLEE